MITSRPAPEVTRAQEEIMYRVYLYYLRGSRSKDFESPDDAISYAEEILTRGHVVRVQVEDMTSCKIIFEKFS